MWKKSEQTKVVNYAFDTNAYTKQRVEIWTNFIIRFVLLNEISTFNVNNHLTNIKIR